MQITGLPAARLSYHAAIVDAASDLEVVERGYIGGPTAALTARLDAHAVALITIGTPQESAA